MVYYYHEMAINSDPKSFDHMYSVMYKASLKVTNETLKAGKCCVTISITILGHIPVSQEVYLLKDDVHHLFLPLV